MLGGGELPAASTTWQNINTGNWIDGANWSVGAPDSSIDAVLGMGTVFVSAGHVATAKTLTLGISSTSSSGYVRMTGGSLDTAETYLGTNGYTGDVTVHGGTWSNAGAMHIGYGGTGLLFMDGGTVTTGTTELATLSGADGTLQLLGGVYATDAITEGAGSGHVILGGVTLRAGRDATDFISGFETGDVVLSYGGVKIDTNGFKIGISSIISGTGPLIKTGAGDLTLTAVNTYDGNTTVKAGRLLVDQGSIGNANTSGKFAVGMDSGDDGTLELSNGGSISSDDFVIGSAAGSKGKLVVDGGTVDADEELAVGDAGAGSVYLHDGTVTGRRTSIGSGSGSSGFVSVESGTWQSDSIFIGPAGNGTLQITGGSVSATFSISMAGQAGGQATLVIGSTADHQGILAAGGLEKASASGSAQVTFQGGILRATRDQASLLSNFSEGEVVTQGRGAYLDTNGYEVSIRSGISGTGQVVKQGAGTLLMEVASTYSGGTIVKEGTLANANRAAFGTGLVTIDGGTLQAYDATIYGIALKSGTLEISPFGQSGLTLASGTSFSMTGGTWSLDQMMPGMHGTFLGDATNTFSITGGTLDLFGATVHTSISYQLFQGFGSGSVSGLTITGYDTTRYLANLGNDGLLTFAAVPESQTIVLVLAGGLCLAVMHRRMRRCACEG